MKDSSETATHVGKVADTAGRYDSVRRQFSTLKSLTIVERHALHVDVWMLSDCRSAQGKSGLLT